MSKEKQPNFILKKNTIKIAFYISDYGYGHVTRSITVIRGLLERFNELEIIVCHSFAYDFLNMSINDDRVLFRKTSTDVGYILNESTLELDHKKIKKMYDDYLNNRERKINKEYDFLITHQITHVFSDINPHAIEAASNANIESIGISNFLWSDVYINIVSEKKLGVMRNAYSKMNYYMALEGNMNSLGSGYTYSHFSREVNDSEVKRIRAELKISSSDTLIFYGLGMKIDHSYQLIEELPLWSSPNCKFIVSSHIKINHPNVYQIPITYTETQNYIAASDFTITKPGWSTVAEALNGNSRLLLIKRKSFKEDNKTLAFLAASSFCKVYTLNDASSLYLSEKVIKELKDVISLKEKDNSINVLIDDIELILKGVIK